MLSKIGRIAGALKRALAAPDVAQRVAQLGGEMQKGTPEHAEEFIRQQMALWARVVKERRITVD